MTRPGERRVSGVYPNPRSKPNRAGQPEFCFTVSVWRGSGWRSRTYTHDSEEAAETARAEHLGPGEEEE